MDNSQVPDFGSLYAEALCEFRNGLRDHESNFSVVWRKVIQPVVTFALAAHDHHLPLEGFGPIAPLAQLLSFASDDNPPSISQILAILSNFEGQTPTLVAPTPHSQAPGTHIPSNVVVASHHGTSSVSASSNAAMGSPIVCPPNFGSSTGVPSSTLDAIQDIGSSSTVSILGSGALPVAAQAVPGPLPNSASPPEVATSDINNVPGSSPISQSLRPPQPMPSMQAVASLPLIRGVTGFTDPSNTSVRAAIGSGAQAPNTSNPPREMPSRIANRATPTTALHETILQTVSASPLNTPIPPPPQSNNPPSGPQIKLLGPAPPDGLPIHPTSPTCDVDDDADRDYDEEMEQDIDAPRRSRRPHLIKSSATVMDEDDDPETLYDSEDDPELRHHPVHLRRAKPYRSSSSCATCSESNSVCWQYNNKRNKACRRCARRRHGCSIAAAKKAARKLEQLSGQLTDEEEEVRDNEEIVDVPEKRWKGKGRQIDPRPTPRPTPMAHAKWATTPHPTEDTKKRKRAPSVGPSNYQAFEKHLRVVKEHQFRMDDIEAGVRAVDLKVESMGQWMTQRFDRQREQDIEFMKALNAMTQQNADVSKSTAALVKVVDGVAAKLCQAGINVDGNNCTSTTSHHHLNMPLDPLSGYKNLSQDFPFDFGIPIPTRWGAQDVTSLQPQDRTMTAIQQPSPPPPMQVPHVGDLLIAQGLRQQQVMGVARHLQGPVDHAPLAPMNLTGSQGWLTQNVDSMGDEQMPAIPTSEQELGQRNVAMTQDCHREKTPPAMEMAKIPALEMETEMATAMATEMAMEMAKEMATVMAQEMDQEMGEATVQRMAAATAREMDRELATAKAEAKVNGHVVATAMALANEQEMLAATPNEMGQEVATVMGKQTTKEMEEEVGKGAGTVMVLDNEMELENDEVGNGIGAEISTELASGMEKDMGKEMETVEALATVLVRAIKLDKSKDLGSMPSRHLELPATPAVQVATREVLQTREATRGGVSDGTGVDMEVDNGVEAEVAQEMEVEKETATAMAIGNGGGVINATPTTMEVELPQHLHCTAVAEESVAYGGYPGSGALTGLGLDRKRTTHEGTTAIISCPPLCRGESQDEYSGGLLARSTTSVSGVAGLGIDSGGGMKEDRIDGDADGVGCGNSTPLGSGGVRQGDELPAATHASGSIKPGEISNTVGAIEENTLASVGVELMLVPLTSIQEDECLADDNAPLLVSSPQSSSPFTSPPATPRHIPSSPPVAPVNRTRRAGSKMPIATRILPLCTS